MTINNSNNKKVYTGTGTSVFVYDFKIFNSSDLLVQILTILDGSLETLVETTDYTVSGVGDAGGGNVTLTVASFPSGLSPLYKIILTRNVPITQTTDYVENDSFPAETHEEALDKLTMIVQQQDEKISRAVLQSPDLSSDLILPTPEADKVIGWNSAGTGLENKSTDQSAADAAIAAQAAAELAEAHAELAETNAETAEANAEAAAVAAAASAVDAANSAASVNLPSLTGASDAKKKLGANSAGTAYELQDGETLQDIDGDTKIQVEESSDEDIIRFDTGGTQRALIDSNGLSLQSGVQVKRFLDEDDMATDAADGVPTQQSVKAYVDAKAILSNVIYQWIGHVSTHLYVGTGTAPATGSEVNQFMMIVSSTTYQEVLNGKFIKIAGINTVTVKAGVWRNTTGPGDIQVDIGGQTGSAGIDSSTVNTEVSFTIDVSGLSNGTAYNISVSLKNDSGGASNRQYLGWIMMFGS